MARPSRAARLRERLALLRALAGFEATLQRKLASLLRRQGKTLATTYAARLTITTFDLLPFRTEALSIFAAAYQRVTDHFGARLRDAIKPAKSFALPGLETKASVASAPFVAAYRQWVSTKALTAVEDMDETTIKRLKNRITAALEENPYSLASDIATLIEDTMRAGNVRVRAETIARTEMHSAMSHAQLTTAKDIQANTGLVLQKSWCSTLDDRTREEHQDADGQTVAIDAPFFVGGELLAAPGTGNDAANNINCRCCVLYTEAE